MSWMPLSKGTCLVLCSLQPRISEFFLCCLCLFLFFATWIFYKIYSGIWTRLYLTEFILFVTTDSAVVAQVVSCYVGRHGWNRCHRKIFFIFFPLLSQAYLSYSVFVCSFENGLLPHRPELVSSALRVLVKLQFLALICGSWFIFVLFFSFPSRCWRSTALDRKTLACLDAGRHPDSIEKLPWGKVWTPALHVCSDAQ